jgi:hypothetical protein
MYFLMKFVKLKARETVLPMFKVILHSKRRRRGRRSLFVFCGAKTLGITTLSITTLSIIGLIFDTQHNNILYDYTLSKELCILDTCARK